MVKMVIQHGKNHAHGNSKAIHLLVVMLLMPLVHQNNQPDGNDSLDQNNANLDAQNQQDSDNQNNQ